jgi:hypothetical protein
MTQNEKDLLQKVKKLAIKGHPTRGNEVIKLLEMMGGKNVLDLSGHCIKYIYYVYNRTIISSNLSDKECEIFTLEDFLEKYPYKVGDFVSIPEYESEVRICEMQWDGFEIQYKVYRVDEEEWYTSDELLDYNDNPNKTTDCEKCGLHFGSIRCFDKDCPNNTPKSNAVGLKDGKVIDCKVNKEIDMNDEVKPIFKVGDEIARADGLTNSYIVTGITSKYYSLEAPYTSGVGVLPVNKQDEYILVNRSDDKEPEPKAPILSNRYDYAEGKCGYVIPDGYEFDCIKEGFQTEIILKPKKPTYPKTYKECCDVLGINTMDNDAQGYKANLIIQFQELIIARDAYLKIAGDELGLGKPWKPDWLSGRKEEKYCIGTQNNEIWHDFSEYGGNEILAFPTMEMRDAFYENFKDLIEQCKELL